MRHLIKTVALFEAFSLAFILINLWFIAFLQGGSLMVRIDAFGEMWIEYVLWLVLTPLLVLGGHYTLSDW